MLIEKCQRYLMRIARMQRNELLDRGRQAVGKRSDALLRLIGHDFSKDVLGPKPANPGRFVFQPGSIDLVIKLMRERLPGRAEEIVQEANHALQHRFNLLGFEGLQCGMPSGKIDWHWDAVHQKRSPRQASYRIRYLDFDECGDSKVIWELNRHQHFVTLAKAYRLTQDRRYLEEILVQKADWEEQNPYPIGINWASSLEVGFRTLSWLWTCYLLQGVRGFPARERWLPGFAVHGRHIERYLSTYFSPNTHLLGEGVALFFLGVLCPELRSAERWKNLGWRIVLEESARQVHSDGLYFEQSTHYHVYALDFVLHAAILAKMNDMQAPQRFEETIGKMLDALCLLARDGPPPQFGDDDGGRLFDPRRNRSEHLLDPLCTGAALFHRSEFKSVAHMLCEETLWLLGEQGVATWDDLEEPDVSHESAALAASGYYFLSATNSQLIVDGGPLGAQGAGHGHADALAIWLHGNGHTLLTDAGTFEYVGRDRDVFRSTAMHNTLQVDGMSQAETMGEFSWGRLTQSKVDNWTNGRSFDLLVASHDGYCRLRQPVIHRRWVLSLKNGMYFVRDVVEGSGVHRVDISWHLGPELELLKSGKFRLKGSVYGLALAGAEDPAWRIALEPRTYSPAYGRKTSGTALRFSAEVSLPTEFSVLLIASENVERVGGVLKRNELSSTTSRANYEYSSQDSIWSFEFDDTGSAWRSGAISSDARLVCREVQSRSSEEKLILCNGSYVTVDGGEAIHCTRNVEWAESHLSKGIQKVFSSDPSSIIIDDVFKSRSEATGALVRKT